MFQRSQRELDSSIKLPVMSSEGSHRTVIHLHTGRDSATLDQWLAGIGI